MSNELVPLEGSVLESERQLGDLIVAAFDEAAQYSTDPTEVSRLATRAVIHIVERGRGPSLVPKRSPVVRMLAPSVVQTLAPSARQATAPLLRLLPRERPKLHLVPTGDCP